MSKEIFIAIRDGNGTGTRRDPFNGSVPSALDKVLANVGYKNTTIHFGPGVFRTNGFGGLNSIAVALTGQRWVGAGMNATTLQLVGATPVTPKTPTPVAVVGGVNLEGFEICDLTLDVNLARQPKQDDPMLGARNAPIKADGVNLWGRNIRISRVRVINWGTHTALEAFPLYIEGGPPGGAGENVIEDCMVEQPDFSPAREITLISNHARGDAPNILSTVRNCYLDGDFTTGFPPAAESILVMTEAGAEVKVETEWPHGFADQESVVIAGSTVPRMNDRFTTRYYSETAFFIRKPYFGSRNFGGNPTVQRYVPKAMPVTLDRAGGTVNVITPEPHGRKAGDWIRISGAAIHGELDTRYFNGSFQVTRVSSPRTLSYKLWDDPGSNVDPGAKGLVWLDRWPSRMIVIAANEGGVGLRGLPQGFGRVQTAAPHFRTPGDYVYINGLFGEHAAVWNGYFKVTEVRSNRLLICKLNTDRQPVDVPVDAKGFYQAAALRYNFQGLTTDVGFGSRASGNRLTGLNRSGPYHDAGPAPVREAIAYNNYASSCYVGLFSNVQTARDREYWSIAHDNIFELQDYPPSVASHEQPAGILLWGPYPMDSDLVTGIYAIGSVWLHDNHIRFMEGGNGSGSPNGPMEYGINVRSVKEARIEENLITLPKAVRPLACKQVGFATFTRNLKGNGTEVLEGIWPGY